MTCNVDQTMYNLQTFLLVFKLHFVRGRRNSHSCHSFVSGGITTLRALLVGIFNEISWSVLLKKIIIIIAVKIINLLAESSLNTLHNIKYKRSITYTDIKYRILK